MTDERTNLRAMPAFRAVGTGSLVTRSCMGCSKNRLTTGSTGSGLRWRCAQCSTARAAVAQT